MLFVLLQQGGGYCKPRTHDFEVYDISIMAVASTRFRCTADRHQRRETTTETATTTEEPTTTDGTTDAPTTTEAPTTTMASTITEAPTTTEVSTATVAATIMDVPLAHTQTLTSEIPTSLREVGAPLR